MQANNNAVRNLELLETARQMVRVKQITFLERRVCANRIAFLQWVLDVIRIAGITLAVVLGIMDYVKATASSKDDNIAAANKNFSKRLLSVALLFLAPTIITFVLQLLNIGTTAANPSCGLN